jgi:hypothetical protein
MVKEYLVEGRPLVDPVCSPSFWLEDDVYRKFMPNFEANYDIYQRRA